MAKGQEHPRVILQVTGHQHGLPREARESLFLETLKSHLCQDVPGLRGLFVGRFGPLRGLCWAEQVPMLPHESLPKEWAPVAEAWSSSLLLLSSSLLLFLLGPGMAAGDGDRAMWGCTTIRSPALLFQAPCLLMLISELDF